MKKTSRFLMLVLTGLASSSITACGGDTNPAELIVGMECDYAPFNWTATKSSEYTLEIANHKGTYADGYDVQIVKHLSAELNRPIKIYKLPWASLEADLQLNSIDLVIAGMTDTEERRQTIDFTDEYYRSELVLITSSVVASSYTSPLSSSELSTLLSNQIVVSQKDTVTDSIINTFKTSYGAIHATPVSTFAIAANDVSLGSAFAMTAELPVAESIVGAFPNLGIVRIDQEILGEQRASLGVSVGIRKGEETLKQQINSALAKLTTDNRLDIMREAVKRSNGI